MVVQSMAEAGRLGEIVAVVFDEFHLLGESRGATLERTIARLLLHARRRLPPPVIASSLSTAVDRHGSGTSGEQPAGGQDGCVGVHGASPIQDGDGAHAGSAQIIGMSATLPNLSELVGWLTPCAKFEAGSVREVPLHEHLVPSFGVNKMRFLHIDGTPMTTDPFPPLPQGEAGDMSAAADRMAAASAKRGGSSRLSTERERLGVTLEVASPALAAGKSVLVFCGTKRECTEYALRAAELRLVPGPSGGGSSVSCGGDSGGGGSGNNDSGGSGGGRGRGGTGACAAEDRNREAAATLTVCSDDSSEHQLAEGVVAVLEELEHVCPDGVTPGLEAAIRRRCGFYHSGLSEAEQKVVERAYSEGHLRFLVSTSSLSEGVNLPVRCAAGRSCWAPVRSAIAPMGSTTMPSSMRLATRGPLPTSSYAHSCHRAPTCHAQVRVAILAGVRIGKGELLPPTKYRQMVGRAGRKGLESRGDAYVVVASEEELRHAIDLANAPMPRVSSQLMPSLTVTAPTAASGDSSVGSGEHDAKGHARAGKAIGQGLSLLLLESVAGGLVRSADEVRLLLQSTFWAHAQLVRGVPGLVVAAEMHSAIQGLVQRSLLRWLSSGAGGADAGVWRTTPRGYAVCSASAMCERFSSSSAGGGAFDEVDGIQGELRVVRTGGLQLTSELHLLYLCVGPEEAARWAATNNEHHGLSLNIEVLGRTAYGASWQDMEPYPSRMYPAHPELSTLMDVLLPSAGNAAGVSGSERLRGALLRCLIQPNGADRRYGVELRIARRLWLAKLLHDAISGVNPRHQLHMAAMGGSGASLRPERGARAGSAPQTIEDGALTLLREAAATRATAMCRFCAGLQRKSDADRTEAEAELYAEAAAVEAATAAATSSTVAPAAADAESKPATGVGVGGSRSTRRPRLLGDVEDGTCVPRQMHAACKCPVLVHMPHAHACTGGGCSRACWAESRNDCGGECARSCSGCLPQRSPR